MNGADYGTRLSARPSSGQLMATEPVLISVTRRLFFFCFSSSSLKVLEIRQRSARFPWLVKRPD